MENNEGKNRCNISGGKLRSCGLHRLLGVSRWVLAVFLAELQVHNNEECVCVCVCVCVCARAEPEPFINTILSL